MRIKFNRTPDTVFQRGQLPESADPLYVLSLEGLLAMKKSLGREKDLADIRRIEDLLRGARQAQD